ncbi:lycopene cyclase domain-containing protein [Demequina sp. NBRC 110054]|uniref:lycopene cyclase domain-containing protein n=1 Tax=Demequina sp. NBRC 110054 TaxID=1570343 RepID=UPI000A03AB72|nr:lycopene cyclase domain-containing protein [Demequina sp. NBRC 110054]
MTNYVTMMGLLLVVALIPAIALLRRSPKLPLVWTGLVLLALTAIFDNLIVGAGIVGYDDELILGIRVPIAPIEDFGYAIAAVLLVPALWRWNWRLAPREATTASSGSSTATSSTAPTSPARDDAPSTPSEDVE